MSVAQKGDHRRTIVLASVLKEPASDDRLNSRARSAHIHDVGLRAAILRRDHDGDGGDIRVETDGSAGRARRHKNAIDVDRSMTFLHRGCDGQGISQSRDVACVAGVSRREGRSQHADTQCQVREIGVRAGAGCEAIDCTLLGDSVVTVAGDHAIEIGCPGSES